MVTLLMEGTKKRGGVASGAADAGGEQDEGCFLIVLL